MKTILRDWVIPPGIYRTLGYIKNYKAYVESQKKQRKLHRLRELASMRLTERCFIVGTGPSLKGVDLISLSPHLVLGLNSWYLHPQFPKIENKLCIFGGMAEVGNKEALYVYRQEIVDKTSSVPAIVSVFDEDILFQTSNTDGKRFYFYDVDQPIEQLSKRGIKLGEPFYHCNNVAIVALQLAIALGYKEIVLLGMDHDMVRHAIERTNSHFYQPEESTVNRLTDVKFIEGTMFPDIGYVFKGNGWMWDTYRALREYANSEGINIYNASSRSILDVFPRRCLSDFISR
jgi:hypothetical protein